MKLLRQHCVLGLHSFLFPYIFFITGCCIEQLRKVIKTSTVEAVINERLQFRFYEGHIHPVSVITPLGIHQRKNSFWKRIASRQRKHARHHSEQVWRCNFTLFKECYPPACNRLPSLVVNNTLEHALVHRELIVQCIKVYNLGKLLCYTGCLNMLELRHLHQ